MTLRDKKIEAEGPDKFLKLLEKVLLEQLKTLATFVFENHGRALE